MSQGSRPSKSVSAQPGERSDLFHLGPVRVDPSANEIERDGRSLHLEPKVMTVLLRLVEEPGKTISKETLLDAVWPDAIVEENALSRAISQLRKALGDHAREPQFIETVPKSGYRLICPVIEEPKRPRSSPVLRFAPANQATAPTLLKPASPKLAPWLFIIVAGVLLLAAIPLWQKWAKAGSVEPTKTRPLTSLPGTESQPKLSPDGRSLVFVAQGATSVKPTLYRIDVAGGTPQRLTDEETIEFSPTWSPDGLRIGFIRTDQKTSAVYSVPWTGGPTRKEMDLPQPYSGGLVYSPDGDHILISMPQEDRRRLGFSRVHLATGASETLTSPPSGELGDILPELSPDGRYLGFARMRNVNMGDLWVLELATGKTRRLTHDHAYIGGFSWFGDSNRIAFSSNRTGTFKLWTMALDSKEPVWLSSVHTYDPSSPLMTSDQSSLIYLEWFYDNNIWQQELTSEGVKPPQKQFSSSRWDFHATFAPDGERVAFVSNRAGTAQLWIGPTRGGSPLQLTQDSEVVIGAPSFHPDGQRLVFEVQSRGRIGIGSIDAAGGTIQMHHDQAGLYRSPCYSADGDWIYFASRMGADWGIWKVAVAGGLPEKVLQNGAGLARESADGRRLYFSKLDDPSLWYRELSNGQEKRIADLEGSHWNHWVLRGNRIFLLTGQASGHSLITLDAEGQKISEIPLNNQSIDRGPGVIDIHPAGHTLLFTQVDQNESDIYLAENPVLP